MNTRTVLTEPRVIPGLASSFIGQWLNPWRYMYVNISNKSIKWKVLSLTSQKMKQKSSFLNSVPLTMGPLSSLVCQTIFIIIYTSEINQVSFFFPFCTSFVFISLKGFMCNKGVLRSQGTYAESMVRLVEHQLS